ncbi:MAG: hypothetical protein E4H01_11895 [Lysobacterales bacterium]|nr:MAG: hypothetical protein E4H01_11895 [Xanthomonadales bacterium]
MNDDVESIARKIEFLLEEFGNQTGRNVLGLEVTTVGSGTKYRRRVEIDFGRTPGARWRESV